MLLRMDDVRCLFLLVIFVSHKTLFNTAIQWRALKIMEGIAIENNSRPAPVAKKKTPEINYASECSQQANWGTSIRCFPRFHGPHATTAILPRIASSNVPVFAALTGHNVSFRVNIFSRGCHTLWLLQKLSYVAKSYGNNLPNPTNNYLRNDLTDWFVISLATDPKSYLTLHCQNLRLAKCQIWLLKSQIDRSTNPANIFIKK